MWPFTKKRSTLVRQGVLGEIARAIGEPNARMDGWQSMLTGFGVPEHDKRLSADFAHEPLNTYEAMELWRGDPLAARIIETRPNEMLRPGFELFIEDDDKELAKQVTSIWEDLHFDDALWMATCYENAYGGSAIYLGVNDLQDVSEPLNIAGVIEIGFLEVLEPAELQPVRWQRDFTQKDFGKPTHYRLQPVSYGGSTTGTYNGSIVHASRLIIFPGIKVSRRQISSNYGWGDSLLGRCRSVLRDFNVTWVAAGALVQDFSQVVYKLKGLAEAINLGKDQEIINRIRTIELSRSVLRATLIDADLEEFERKQTPLNGLPELMDRFATMLASSAEMPVSLLMGESPAGLNATGDANIRWFYDHIDSARKRKIRPAAERLAQVCFSALDVEEPESWSIEFPPLWQPTEKEQAETRKLQMEIDTAEISAQIVSPEEIRNSRHGGRQYSYDTKIDKSMVINPVLPPGLPTQDVMVVPPKQLPEPVEPKEVAPPVETPAPKAEPVEPKVEEPKVEEPKEEPVQALNGAQVASLVAVITAAVNKTIPRDAAVQTIMLAYNVPMARALLLLGEENFVASPAPEVHADAADRHRQQVLNQLAPDGTCASCGDFYGANALEVDHINGRDWDPNAMSVQQRGLKYLDEYNSGVSMQALCRSCNASDGAKNKQVR